MDNVSDRKTKKANTGTLRLDMTLNLVNSTAKKASHHAYSNLQTKIIDIRCNNLI